MITHVRWAATALVVALLAAACGAGTAVPIAASSAAPMTVDCPERRLDRVAGDDRVATAIAVSQDAWTASVTVVLASAEDYPDALAGGALAASHGAPTLLTPHDHLHPDVASEIERLDPDTVLVVGGPKAVSDTVLEEVERTSGQPTARRLSGTDRYATAAAIAREVGAGSVAALATGQRFPDAVAAGALAAVGDPIPTLLTPTAHLHDEVRQALADLGVTTVLIVGGPVAVDPSVEQALVDAGFDVQRLEGPDRYATSAAVAEHAAALLGDRLQGAVLATGGAFPDALSAAPYAARHAAVLATVPTRSLALPEGVAALLDRERDRLACNAIIGGPAAVSVQTAEQVASPLKLDPPDGPPVLIGAGDIAECGFWGDEATADVVEDLVGTVATFGDNAYDNGTHREFLECYHPSWGRFKDRTRPAVGNHEYGTAGADGHFDYFGAAAGEPGEGWYSYDLGPWWHVVVLNSQCPEVGGCGAGSPQEQWLRADLAANTDRHVVAYWHVPRWSSGRHGSSTWTQAFWQALYEYGAEVIVAAHDHDYERFAPLAPDGSIDETYGIRSFVVGTGGGYVRSFDRDPLPATEVRQGTDYGVLALTLRRDGYDWRFHPVAGDDFTDEGSGTTHPAP